MKLSKLYETAVKKGMKEDQRPRRQVIEIMQQSKKDYRKAKGVDRKTFDMASLKNPYADTRILYAPGDIEVKNVMVGIDIDVSELVMADRLRDKGLKIDMVISHHPGGRGLAGLHKVMSLQPQLWKQLGLESNVAESMMKERQEEVFRGVSSSNHTKVMDAAKILGIPLMCIHTAADNCVANYLQKLFDSKKPKKIKDVLRMLKNIPEYTVSMKTGAGPYTLIGKDDDKAGKIFVDMTGGTSGPGKMFARLSQSGVKTIVGMHCKESNYKIAKGEFLNFVIAGHISSDTLGMNILFDAIEKVHKLNFIECSGFKRIRRK